LRLLPSSTGFSLPGILQLRWIMRHCLVALACMLALSVSVCPSSVADRTWERVGGPPGGLGYDIRMDPSDPDRMLVTDAFAGLHVSFDGGLTWEPTNDGIEVRTGQSGDKIPVFSVTFDPTDPRIVWAGTQDALGIYRSEDGGRTWEKKVNGIIEQQGISFRGFTVDPADSNVVYAAA